MLSGKKSLMSMVLALLLLCGAALAEESTSGATALTNADYQQIVSTYSIDASIPGYADYLERYEDAAHPDVTVTVDADTFVRYEDAGIAARGEGNFVVFDGRRVADRVDCGCAGIGSV